MHFCVQSWRGAGFRSACQVVDISRLFNPQSFLTAIKQLCGPLVV